MDAGKLFTLVIIIFIFVSLITVLPISADDDSPDVSFDLALETGWNLIAFPVSVNWMASDVVGELTNCTMVSHWDPLLQTFKTHTTGGYDFQIQDGYGYYLYTTSSENLTVSGPAISSVSIIYVEQFNYLGWYQDTSTTASALMASIAGCIKVQIYDAINQVDVIYESSADDDFVISQGMGYMIDIDSDTINLNLAPNKPSNPSPYNTEEIIDITTLDLCVTVNDPEEDTMNVTFFWNNGTIIDSDENILSGYDACITISNLEFGNEYRWYAMVSDGENSITSDIFMFSVDNNPINDEEKLNITGAPNSINENEEFNIIVKAEGTPVENVEIFFHGVRYYTNINGVATLTAPSVTKNSIISIMASKEGFQIDTLEITIVDITIIENIKPTIQLLAPINGEICSKTYNIVWRISDMDTQPSRVKVQYKYKENEWVKLIDNLDPELNIYHWDTTKLPDGYPYKIKISLIEDTNSDGVFDTIISEDISNGFFAIDNSKDHLGYINGRVVEEKNATYYPLENVKIYVIISEIQGVITSKSTLTDENGSYQIPAPAGTYAMKASKIGYKTSVQENIVVWAGIYTMVNFSMKEGIDDTLLLLSGEHRDEIDEGIRERNVGAEISVTYRQDISDYEKFIVMYDSVNITPLSIKMGNISLIVDGNESSQGRTIVVNLEADFFDISKGITIIYDNQLIQMADNISDILNPDDDGSNPEYLITYGADGIQILVSIPHFSQHTINIFTADKMDSKAVEEVVESIGGITALIFYILFFSIIAIAYIAPILYFEKKK